MKINIVTIKEIASQRTLRMDAKYWIKKKEKAASSKPQASSVKQQATSLPQSAGIHKTRKDNYENK